MTRFALAIGIATLLAMTGIWPGMAGVSATGHDLGPEVAFKSPEDGDIVSGVVRISVQARETDFELDFVTLFIAGTFVADARGKSVTYDWDTTGLVGTYELTATAYDILHQSTSTTIHVTPEGSPGGPSVLSLSLDPYILTGGATSTGTVGLTAAAPPGGTTVALASSDPGAASVPPSFIVPEGQRFASFTVTTAAVASTTSVTISAAAGGGSRSDTLTLARASDGTLDALTISPNQVTGGETTQGRVTLVAAVGSDTEVALVSSDHAVATVPASVIVPAGALNATFPVTTLPNNADQVLFSVISGHAGGVTRTSFINTLPAPEAPTITSVELSSTTLGGGGSATGIVTFDAPLDDGVRIFYESSHPEVVQVPEEAGEFWSENQRAFPVTTSPVAANTDVTITVRACCGGDGQTTVVLTVTTDAPPAADVVAVKAASWKGDASGGTLSVTATSTSSMAILQVYHAGTDFRIMTLVPAGGGKYTGSRALSSQPDAIDVRSNLGGSATEIVS